MISKLRRLLSPPSKSNGPRLPFLVWGDAMPQGGRPQVRRALAGADAHECMYSWVYLNELLAVRDLLAGTPRDPQNQVSEELEGVFGPVVELLGKDGELVELGSTMFASIEKVDLLAKKLGKDVSSVLFSGIEYSPFMRRAAASLHPGHALNQVVEPHQWSRSRERVVHVSRFVGSYAFRSTEEFAAELARADAFHIIDVFGLGDEFASWDLGLPITFFDIGKLAADLPGFDLYATKVTPEYHYAGRKKAMVLRLLGVRKGIDYRPDAPKLTANVAEQVDRSMTAEQWNVFAEYKRHFPVWGGPPGHTKTELAELLSPSGIDLHFDDAAASAVVKATKWL
jgi:hypothetical protein